jgi:dihydroxy-acid dehydratase
MRSDALKSGIARSPARAMLRAVGLQDEDFRMPFVGVVNTWTDGMPCNFHLRELAGSCGRGSGKPGSWGSSSGRPR